MKNLLYLISIIFSLIAIQSCQSNNASAGENKDVVSSDSVATSRDTLIFQGDTIIADSLFIRDSISKEEKYLKDSTEKHEAPNHQSPDEAKLDSIKNAKKKKKKD
jgi:hypothetical protein